MNGGVVIAVVAVADVARTLVPPAQHDVHHPGGDSS